MFRKGLAVGAVARTALSCIPGLWPWSRDTILGATAASPRWREMPVEQVSLPQLGLLGV